jgi:hypothetical protein
MCTYICYLALNAQDLAGYHYLPYVVKRENHLSLIRIHLAIILFSLNLIEISVTRLVVEILAVL